MMSSNHSVIVEKTSLSGTTSHHHSDEGKPVDDFEPEANLQLKRTFSQFLCVAAPKIAAGGAQLFTNLLLVRHFGPSRSGVLFVCITAIILSDAVLGSALDVAVLKLATSGAGRERLACLEIQKAALMLKILGCALLAAPILVFAGPLSTLLFHKDGDARLLMLSLVSLFALLVLRSVQTCFQILRKFWLYGAADLLHSLTKYGGIGVLLATGWATPISVLTIYAVGPLLVGMALLLTATREILTARFSWQAFGELWSAVKWYLGSAAAASTNTRIDILLLSALAGTAQAGLFSAAQVVVMPVQLIGMYLGVVFAPRVMPLWEQGQLSPIFHKFQAWTLGASLALFGLAFLLADRATALLLPLSYHGSSALIVLLLPSALTALINFPWAVSLLMFAHPRMLLVLELVSLPLLIVLYRLFVVPFGAFGAAAVTSGFAITKTVIYQIIAGRTIRFGPSRNTPMAAPIEATAGGARKDPSL
jgi:O-antigen/teichoic acid export membrane protein